VLGLKGLGRAAMMALALEATSGVRRPSGRHYHRSGFQRLIGHGHRSDFVDTPASSGRTARPQTKGTAGCRQGACLRPAVHLNPIQVEPQHRSVVRRREMRPRSRR
jgi:hypothetical protein